jgi:pSer/pThr/pTyr-binding forkhead associated (FHA) protein
MQIVLTVMGGVHNGREIPINVPVFLIGRDPSCHLRPASPEVSRQHCALVIRGERAFLRDYGSRNGTNLNHRVLMHGELQLEDGDFIEVGPLAFKVALMAHAPSPPPDHAGSPSTQDTAIQAINGEGASPDDTILVPRTTLPTNSRGPKDSPEMLCKE